MYQSNWFIITLNLLIYFSKSANSKLITCVCTTAHCQAQGQTTCNTTSMCYSQYLDRKDGSNPLVRGCIISKTPLLCENRRPAVRDHNWPILACCNTNLCNQDVVPTVPPWMVVSTKITASSSLPPESTDNGSNLNGKESIYLVDSNNSASKSNAKSTVKNLNDINTNGNELSSSGTTSGAASARISPLYITVLVVGVMSLVIIGVVALFILRRNDRFYETSDYITHHFKGIAPPPHHHHQHIREDPEMHLPLPRSANEIYDNKIAVST